MIVVAVLAMAGLPQASRAARAVDPAIVTVHSVEAQGAHGHERRLGVLRAGTRARAAHRLHAPLRPVRERRLHRAGAPGRAPPRLGQPGVSRQPGAEGSHRSSQGRRRARPDRGLLFGVRGCDARLPSGVASRPADRNRHLSGARAATGASPCLSPDRAGHRRRDSLGARGQCSTDPRVSAARLARLVRTDPSLVGDLDDLARGAAGVQRRAHVTVGRMPAAPEARQGARQACNRWGLWPASTATTFSGYGTAIVAGIRREGSSRSNPAARFLAGSVCDMNTGVAYGRSTSLERWLDPAVDRLA